MTRLRHILPVRVYFEDTDAGGIVYYARYLQYAERGRTEFLREAGIEHREMMAELGVAVAVRRCNVEYLKPALLGDLLRVETLVTKVKGASFTMAQTVYRGEETLVTLDVTLACLSLDGGAPTRLPEALKDILQQKA